MEELAGDHRELHGRVQGRGPGLVPEAWEAGERGGATWT